MSDDDKPPMQPLGDLAGKVDNLRARLAGEAAGPVADPEDLREALDEETLRRREAGPPGDSPVMDSSNVAAFAAKPKGKAGGKGKKASAADLARAEAERVFGGGGEAGDGDEPPEPPRHMGYDLAKMNEDFALVLMGSKAVVYREQKDAPIEDQQRVLTLEAFRAWFLNRYTEFKVPGQKAYKITTWATAWLQNRKRRSYAGIEFHPLGPNESTGGTPGYLNLWSGLSVTAKRDPEKWKTLRQHLLENVCAEDAKLYAWVFGFFAHMVQKPRERLGVALVMRGRMGTGKSIVGEIMGSLCPRHYFLVDDPRYVTGNFNAHMASCLLLQADEAVWAGDKTAEGRLRGLITSPIQQVESKGVDPIRLKNYVRLVMTSNEDWVVPAGKDERRYCVLDVKPGKAQNHVFFRQLWTEIENGGREALLADLQAFDLTSVDLRVVPKTEALLEQKLRSLNSVEIWWFGRLVEGRPTRKAGKWPGLIAKEMLLDDYIEVSERTGIKRKSSATEFGMAMHKLLPGVMTRRGWCEISDNVIRKWCFELPDIGAARHAFETAVQQPVDWPVDDAASESAVHESERDRSEGVEDFR